jgi:hypothetical protein
LKRASQQRGQDVLHRVPCSLENLGNKKQTLFCPKSSEQIPLSLPTPKCQKRPEEKTKDFPFYNCNGASWAWVRPVDFMFQTDMESMSCEFERMNCAIGARVRSGRGKNNCVWFFCPRGVRMGLLIRGSDSGSDSVLLRRFCSRCPGIALIYQSRSRTALLKDEKASSGGQKAARRTS